MIRRRMGTTLALLAALICPDIASGQGSPPGYWQPDGSSILRRVPSAVGLSDDEEEKCSVYAGMYVDRTSQSVMTIAFVNLSRAIINSQQQRPRSSLLRHRRRRPRQKLTQHYLRRAKRPPIVRRSAICCAVSRTESQP